MFVCFWPGLVWWKSGYLTARLLISDHWLTKVRSKPVCMTFVGPHLANCRAGPDAAPTYNYEQIFLDNLVLITPVWGICVWVSRVINCQNCVPSIPEMISRSNFCSGSFMVVVTNKYQYHPVPSSCLILRLSISSLLHLNSINIIIQSALVSISPPRFTRLRSPFF